MARRKKKLSPVYVVSLAAHLAAGSAIALIPQHKLREVVAIALNEPPPKDEKKVEPPKPKPHPAEPPAHHHRHIAHSEPAPAPSSADNPAALDNIGLALDANATGGLAVRIAPPPPPPPPPVAPPKPKLLVARRPEPECPDDMLHKARPLGVVRPSYTDEARQAHVQGRIRIQLAVNDQGDVTDAHVLAGLGYGLDEAALEAARRLRFAPATRCNRPVAAPFVIAMRFVLGT